MSNTEETPHADIPKQCPTCRIRGRPGQFLLLKRCRRKARVALIDLPGTKGFLVNQADLWDIQEPHRTLFPGSPEPQLATDADNYTAAECLADQQLLPLPYGILDLDPQIVTDPGPPFRVKCYVRDCGEMVQPPTRKFRGESCPVHRIRCHLSGGSPTYTYTQAKRNIIASPDLFAARIIKHPFKFESHRLGYEKSEDALTWNVFRSLQEANCLHLVAQWITGNSVPDEPMLYVWGICSTGNTFEPWDLLIAAREKFESQLPVKRPATEPDVGLYLPGNFLILIECKFTSPNTYYTDGPRKNGQSLTKEELLTIYQDPCCQIIDPEKAQEANRVYYQLYRNVQFASYMSHLAGGDTRPFHVNLVRAGYEHESTSEFRQLVRPEFADRFVRLTWENIHTLSGLHWQKLSRLQEYLATKTANLSQAFHLDLW